MAMVTGHGADTAGTLHCTVSLLVALLSLQTHLSLTGGARVREVAIAEPASC